MLHNIPQCSLCGSRMCANAEFKGGSWFHLLLFSRTQVIQMALQRKASQKKLQGRKSCFGNRTVCHLWKTRKMKAGKKRGGMDPMELSVLESSGTSHLPMIDAGASDLFGLVLGVIQPDQAYTCMAYTVLVSETSLSQHSALLRGCHIIQIRIRSYSLDRTDIWVWHCTILCMWISLGVWMKGEAVTIFTHNLSEITWLPWKCHIQTC